MLDIYNAFGGKGQIRIELKDGKSSTLFRPEEPNSEFTSFLRVDASSGLNQQEGMQRGGPLQLRPPPFFCVR
jgi:hypothetical protein